MTRSTTLRWFAAIAIATSLFGFVSACGGGGSAAGASTSTPEDPDPPATPGAPVNISPPVISTTDHATYLALSASPGTWSNDPTGYAYQWRRNGSAIGGATAASYDTTDADRGTSVAVAVTASNSIGSSRANSAAVSVPPLVTVPPQPTNDPTLGAHGLAYHVSRGSVGPTLSTPAMNTASGSTMLAFVGKGSVYLLSPPFDNKGNSPYVQVGAIHEYTNWPGEGTAMYAFNAIVGGANHLVSVDDSNVWDEVSFAAVEVRNGGVIQDHQWNEVLDSPTHTSRSVTTTGPATLVAVWFGDDASTTPSNPVPNNGFTVIEGVGGAVETVQMFVATRDVATAGTYNVTWTTTPRQGAQLYLVAVQKQ